MNRSVLSFPLEYDSAAVRSTPIAHLLEVVRYRDLLRLLVVRSIKTRYKRSVLGVAWTLLNPLVNMLVMSIAFSALFRTAIPGYPVTSWSGSWRGTSARPRPTRRGPCRGGFRDLSADDSPSPASGTASSTWLSPCRSS
jgi:hypothetical protein